MQRMAEKAVEFDKSIEGALNKTNFDETYKKELKTLLYLKPYKFVI